MLIVLLLIVVIGCCTTIVYQALSHAEKCVKEAEEAKQKKVITYSHPWCYRFTINKKGFTDNVENIVKATMKKFNISIGYTFHGEVIFVFPNSDCYTFRNVQKYMNLLLCITYQFNDSLKFNFTGVQVVTSPYLYFRRIQSECTRRRLYELAQTQNITDYKGLPFRKIIKQVYPNEVVMQHDDKELYGKFFRLDYMDVCYFIVNLHKCRLMNRSENRREMFNNWLKFDQFDKKLPEFISVYGH